MKKNVRFQLVLVLGVLIALVSCDPQPETQSKSDSEKQSEQELEKQSDDFSKSMDDLDEAMNVASQLNERIQLVEKRFKDGEITRIRADELIEAINKRYGQVIEADSDNNPAQYIFPSWLNDLGITEPQNLAFDAVNSFKTDENNMQDGYNSVLYIYKGSYKQALAEADRIAKNAGIPMSEIYRKARELSKKLGKEIDGLKGITYMNYEFGKKEIIKPYKISISVDENGELTLNIVDVKTKIEREKSSLTSKKY